MGHTDDKLKGAANEAMGNLKQGVGDLTDNERLQAEGRAQELKGEGQQRAAEAAQHAEGVLDETSGNIKQGIGKAFDDEQLQAEGKAQELKGEAKQRTS